MAKILSQEEVDALLKSHAKGTKAPAPAAGPAAPAPAAARPEGKKGPAPEEGHPLQLPPAGPGEPGADALPALHARPLRAQLLQFPFGLPAHHHRSEPGERRAAQLPGVPAVGARPHLLQRHLHPPPGGRLRPGGEPPAGVPHHRQDAGRPRRRPQAPAHHDRHRAVHLRRRAQAGPGRPARGLARHHRPGLPHPGPGDQPPADPDRRPQRGGAPGGVRSEDGQPWWA